MTRATATMLLTQCLLVAVLGALLGVNWWRSLDGMPLLQVPSSP